MDPNDLSTEFEEFIKRCMNEVEGVVVDFEIVGEKPYFKEIVKQEGRALAREDFQQKFTEKVAMFFNICRVVKTSFLKNRRFLSIKKLYISNIQGLYIGVYKNKFLYISKFVSDKEKVKKYDIVKSNVFSIFGDSNPGILKIIGWLKHEKNFYFVHEFIETTLEFHIQATVWDCNYYKYLMNEILNTVDHLNKNKNKKLYFTQSSVLIRDLNPVIPIICSLNQDLESQKKHLVSIVNKFSLIPNNEIQNELKNTINRINNLSDP